MNSEWLDSIFQTTIIVANVGLAFMGGFVAVKPPREDDQALKRLYICLFGIVAIVGIVASLWSNKRDRGEQERLQQANREAEVRFSADLLSVKHSNDAILTFVSNPPKGVTQEQMTQFVKAFVQQRDSPIRGINKLAGMSTEGLLSTTKTAATQLLEIAEHEWGWEDEQAYLAAYEIHYKSSSTPQAEIDESMAKGNAVRADIAIKYRAQLKETVSFAINLRDEILRRFPDLKNSRTSRELDSVLRKLRGGAYEVGDLRQAALLVSDLVTLASKPTS